MTDEPVFDLIASTVAVLFPPAAAPPAIGQEQLTAILRPQLTVGGSPDGSTVISSSRDQIDVTVASNKIDVKDQSGDLSHARLNVPRVLREFLGMITQETIGTYGINFIVQLEIEQSERWLGENMLHPRLTERLGAPPASKRISLVVPRDPKVLTVAFENRDDSRIVINYNASQPSERLPEIEQLATEIETQYRELEQIILELGIPA